jgi:hypothetical protein
VILWQRVAWTDHLPQHGFAAQLFIESQELRDQFAVGKVEWTDAEQRILRVSYTLGDIQGIIDIRRDDEHYPWPIHPDLGVMKRDKWLPFEKE